MKELKTATRRKISFIATLKAICWSFFGVRKKSGYEQDAANLNPIYVIVAGILVAILFVTILLLIVKCVVAN
ncbi:MAG: hypothetical protein K0R08_706 [Solimicrobium sp.]|jgi:hypothetical protein|nr:hypothetical protein [Solimicrobium sp.]